MVINTTSNLDKLVVIDTETTGVNSHTCKLLGIVVNHLGDTVYDTNVNEKSLVKYKSFLTDKSIIGHNIKYDLNVLKNHRHAVPDAYFDTMVAYYLLHINKSKKLENIVFDLFKTKKSDLIETYNISTGEKRKTLPDNWYENVNNDLLIEYAISDGIWTRKIYDYLSEELKQKPDLKEWFFNVEMPIVNILSKMECVGVKINRSKLTQLRTELELTKTDLEKRLKWLAGKPNLNLNSSKQIREVLYKQFRLPKINYTKHDEASTDKKTLEKLAEFHAFAKTLLDYREIEKVLSTYTISIIDKLDSNDKLHTNFNQCLTATRRFSSDNPNLQNIPTRSEFGKQVKSCFIPDIGKQFLIADYSQLEPRILAHLSQDKILIDIYNNNEDIYLRAIEICKTKGKTICRQQAKILMLSLMYGKTAYGLAKDFNCSEEEAQEIIDAVLGEMAGVKEYISQCETKVLKTGGWLKTIAGLPLYVGDPYTNSKSVYHQVLRCAVNYPIQGSSQDILKKAIVNIYSKYGRIPVLMVHDELVYELQTDRSQTMNENTAKLIINEMESAWKLSVPLKVEWTNHDHWEK